MKKDVIVKRLEVWRDTLEGPEGTLYQPAVLTVGKKIDQSEYDDSLLRIDIYPGASKAEVLDFLQQVTHWLEQRWEAFEQDSAPRFEIQLVEQSHDER